MVLRDTAVLRALRLQDYHLLWYSFPGYFDFDLQITVMRALQPRKRLNASGLG